MTLERDYFKVRENIREVCERVGRNPDEIKIVAVSKTFPLTKILELNKLGQVDFGENQVKELREKYYSISFHDKEEIRWHLVGHLQSNKVKNIIAFINLIHSVDTVKLAEEIDIHSKKINKTIDVLVQVNTSNELQKYGAAPSDAMNICRQISVFEHIKVRGLMTIAKLTDDKNLIRESFRLLKELFDNIKQEINGFEYLSMGMTNDYDIAIEEGSNMLRIGSAIFGGRV